MITGLIIDDEEKGWANLASLLRMHCPELDIVGFADGVKTGVEQVKKLHPQLLLLDIEMNDGNGFDLLSLCEGITFEVIFVTAYDQYGLNAIRASAIDYILKPINEVHLIEAIRKANGQIRLKADNVRLQNLLHNQS